MSRDEEDDFECVTAALTRQIRKQLAIMSSEQGGPTYGPDQSDDMIRTAKTRALELRRIRDEFEIIMTGAILK